MMHFPSELRWNNTHDRVAEQRAAHLTFSLVPPFTMFPELKLHRGFSNWMGLVGSLICTLWWYKILILVNLVWTNLRYQKIVWYLHHEPTKQPVRIQFGNTSITSLIQNRIVICPNRDFFFWLDVKIKKLKKKSHVPQWKSRVRAYFASLLKVTVCQHYWKLKFLITLRFCLSGR